jgi:hypothetical protein
MSILQRSSNPNPSPDFPDNSDSLKPIPGSLIQPRYANHPNPGNPFT